MTFILTVGDENTHRLLVCIENDIEMTAGKVPLKRIAFAFIVVVGVSFSLFSARLTTRIDYEYDKAYRQTILGQIKDFESATTKIIKEKKYLVADLKGKLDEKESVITALKSRLNDFPKVQNIIYNNKDASILKAATWLCSAKREEIRQRVVQTREAIQYAKSTCSHEEGSAVFRRTAVRYLEYSSGHHTHLAAAPAIDHLLSDRDMQGSIALDSLALKSHFMQECCSRMYVAVHPSLGAVYRLNLPDARRSTLGHSYRSVCFLRRWGSWTGSLSTPTLPTPLKKRKSSRLSAHLIGWLVVPGDRIGDIAAIVKKTIDASATQERLYNVKFDFEVTVVLCCAAKHVDGISISRRIDERCGDGATKPARELRKRWLNDPVLNAVTLTLIAAAIPVRTARSLVDSSKLLLYRSLQYIIVSPRHTKRQALDVITLLDGRASLGNVVAESIYRAGATGANAPVEPGSQFGTLAQLSLRRADVTQALEIKGPHFPKTQAQLLPRSSFSSSLKQQSSWSLLNASRWDPLISAAFPGPANLPNITGSLKLQLNDARRNERHAIASDVAANFACGFYELAATLQLRGKQVHKTTLGISAKPISEFALTHEERHVANLALARCSLAAELSGAEFPSRSLPTLEFSQPLQCPSAAVEDPSLVSFLRTSKSTLDFSWFASSFAPSFGERFEGIRSKDLAIASLMRPFEENVEFIGK